MPTIARSFADEPSACRLGRSFRVVPTGPRSWLNWRSTHLLACKMDALPGAQVTAVESSKSSVADAQHNVGSAGVTVERSTIERYRGGRFDAVIADPPRSGLGRAGVGLIESAQAERCVLVSCDAASLGRDSGLLANAGYRLSSVTLVDMFPHTHHVECISVFER